MVQARLFLPVAVASGRTVDMNSATAATEIIFTRKTADGYTVEIDAAGLVWGRLGTFTRHAGLPRQAAYQFAEAVGLFDLREMPSLVGAAAKLAKAGDVDFWTLVQAAIVASAKAHTIPADMPRAVVTMTLAAYAEPADARLPPGTIPAQRPGRRVKVALPR